jgi:hypothetical protein
MIENKMGKMRLGGMIPHESEYKLPKRFSIKNQLRNEQSTTYYVREDDEGEFIWVDEDTIEIHGIIHKLLYQPSQRANWFTFTIKEYFLP